MAQGKRIAVIGTGASAVQVVPALAEQQPASLTVFQRWLSLKLEKNGEKRFKGQLCGLCQGEITSTLIG